MQKPFTRTELKNGLRVIFAPQKDSVAMTVLVLVEAGSKYESKDINGLSHFLEHMCFKGTTKRPTAMAISAELDGLGAEYNAFTSQEWTGYYAKVQHAKCDQAIDLVADMYLNPVFDPAEIEKEKGVIIEEINMYEDLPQRKVHDVFMSLLYGDQPAGWDIAGPKENIRAMNREQFLKYRGAHYVPRATAVIVAGAFDEKKALAQLESLFGGMPAGPKSPKIATTEAQSKPEVALKFKQSDQSHLVIGCRAFAVTDERRYALDVLSDVLGGGMSSRLFQRVREQMGAAYYVKASSDLYTDHGYFAVSAGVEHNKLEIVVTAILEELAKTAAAPIPAAELRRAKDHLAGGMLLGLETSDSLANYYGAQEVLRLPLQSPDELLKKAEAVTASQVQETAQFMFKNQKLNLALIGPAKEQERIAKILVFS